MRTLSFLAATLVACGGPAATPPAPPPPSPAPPPVAAAAPVVDSGAAAVVVDAGPPPKPGPFAALPPSLPIDVPKDKPAPLKRDGKSWPFHHWDRAEAVVLNWEAYGPGAAMRVYDERGWSSRLAYRTPLDMDRAKRSVDIALAGHGELEVSKCPVPRHAVVLYEGDVPVASINVCFTCHDVLLWPRWVNPTPKKMDKLAEEVLPRYRTLFIDELHFPIWADEGRFIAPL